MSMKTDPDLRIPAGTELHWRYWPPLALLGAAGLLAWFGWWSQTVHVPNRRVPHPPIYRVFGGGAPRLAPWLLSAAPGVGAVGWGGAAGRRGGRRLPPV